MSRRSNEISAWYGTGSRTRSQLALRRIARVGAASPVTGLHSDVSSPASFDTVSRISGRTGARWCVVVTVVSKRTPCLGAHVLPAQRSSRRRGAYTRKGPVIFLSILFAARTLLVHLNSFHRHHAHGKYPQISTMQIFLRAISVVAIFGLVLANAQSSASCTSDGASSRVMRALACA